MTTKCFKKSLMPVYLLVPLTQLSLSHISVERFSD